MVGINTPYSNGGGEGRGPGHILVRHIEGLGRSLFLH